jgi:branched-chain amino acid transport system ATP-binding protein
MITLDHVSMHFGGLVAVDNVSLDIHGGRITGLIGPNGAGKTTLFNMIAGRLIPSDGRILLEGSDITKLAVHERSHLGLARTFQIPQEFARLTVVENLMVAGNGETGDNVFNAAFRRRHYRGEEEEIYHRARETLAFLELDKLARDKAGTLSGGQKKLLELGRALMGNPRIILLDEIGAGINRSLLSRIAEMIARLNAERGLSFCLIEHDLAYVQRLCSDVIVMAEGRVLTRGSVADVREDQRVIEAYFGGGKYEERA